ncbi:sensor histidine kinase [Aquirufa regiilacus]|uniref:histidine kinase n=1 Tax=Aquirufa regiilacus TaxID=3024868 RepID=A0ABU3TNY3_9BACT|nr:MULTISPECIES: sensor histidine kinase [unclassified Aquirufa]MDT8887149.1 sensor histidine kinase [Aquirufa sp. LEPPI-3A]MDU0807578.1 sensor histidine kinase [Aquirufa sp. LEOWEIH-7C]
MHISSLFKALLLITLLLSFQSWADDSYNPVKFKRDLRFQDPQFMWTTWDRVFKEDGGFFSNANVGDLERILEAHWADARKKNNLDLMIKAAIPLAMVYHNQAKFTHGLPFFEFLFEHEKQVPAYYWRHVLIKLEEEYRGKNEIEKAIPIRRLRIKLGFIKTFWEIYRECGLFEDALRDFIQFQPVPARGDYRRLFYLQRLGWLYTDLKNFKKARNIYAQGYREVAEVRAASKATYLPRELRYWEGLFKGLMAECDMELGNYTHAIPMLRFDIQSSLDNPDNQIGKEISLARAYLHRKSWESAKYYMDHARILMAQKVIPTVKLMMLDAYADYYAAQQQYDSAYFYNKALHAYRDTVNAHINRNKSILLLGQLELAKHREESLKNKHQVEVYSESSKLQEFKIKLLSLILGAIIFGSILLYVNFRQKGLLNQNRIQLDLEHERNAVLLKELHHRVKNNLQVIYSLLNLQKRRTKNIESVDLITALQNRIQTIALVHNNLFQSDEMEFVQLDSYVRTLVEHLQQMYAQEEVNPVQIYFDIQDSIKLRFERIGTLGLIINEIVSNAFKYAFVEAEQGILRIEIDQEGSQIRVIIEDNGPGLVDEINRNSNLGMRLIRILSEQMGATYTLHQSQGIKHLITFNV